jgi:hypothetical protein|tara:strand:- start:11791 stop:12045 length:255 start_codon:yes stop_codon:yes gene_type:complete
MESEPLPKIMEFLQNLREEGISISQKTIEALLNDGGVPKDLQQRVKILFEHTPKIDHFTRTDIFEEQQPYLGNNPKYQEQPPYL